VKLDKVFGLHNNFNKILYMKLSIKIAIWSLGGILISGLVFFIGSSNNLQGKLALSSDIVVLIDSSQIPNKTVSPGQFGVEIAQFQIKVASNKVKITQFDLMPDSKQVVGSTPYLNPVLINASNGKIITNGQINNNGYISFKDSFQINSNSVFSLQVVADISTNAKSGSSFRLKPRYVGGSNLSNSKKLKAGISTNVTGTLVDISSGISSANYTISGIVKDEKNVPIADADVSSHYISDQNGKIYRLEVAVKKTDASGKFVITEDELEKGILQRLGYSPEKPYPMTVTMSKNGYLDAYIFDESVNKEESPKMIMDQTWDIQATMKLVPDKLTKTDGAVTVKYYPGQEKCANVAIEKINYFYPKVLTYTGLSSFPESSLIMTFNTSWEQGWGDWWGGSLGIETICYPHTDNIEDPEINSMWNGAIPHELVHVAISGFSDRMPYWSNEGLAQYTYKVINGENFDCNSETLLPVQELKGEFMPYYETGACFWKLLEDDYPGIIPKIVNYIKKLKIDGVILTYKYETNTKDFIEKVLSPVLVDSYSKSKSDADKYLTDFMVQFHYDSAKP